MIKYSAKCTSCYACINVCPKKCIVTDGHDKINIHTKECIKCNLCDTVCQIRENTEHNEPIKIYACVAKNKEIYKQSASGGLVSTVANEYINRGTVVFAAHYMEDGPTITKIENIEEIAGSIYSYSNPGYSYIECQKCLEMGLEVLFIGLPCQISGLLLFLKKKYDKLITIDLLCHGAPDLWLFKKHVDYLQNKYKSKIKRINFRDKTNYRQGPYSIKIELEDGRTHIYPAVTDAYFSGFYNGKILRECCYSCKYASKKRVSDISAGDFWNVQKWSDSFLDFTTVSSVLINTSKGLRIWEIIKDYFFYEEASIEELKKSTHAIISPCKNKQDSIERSKMELDYARWAMTYENSFMNVLRKLKYLIVR